MISYKPPGEVPPEGKKLFLAGSIEMGAAEEWQEEVEEGLAATNWVVLNPRRDDWDPTWEQSKGNPDFRHQVEWELAGMEGADRILLYLSATTKAPISLLELGLFANSSKLLVVCPQGYWRKGNVDIVCERYGVEQCETLEAALAILKSEA